MPPPGPPGGGDPDGFGDLVIQPGDDRPDLTWKVSEDESYKFKDLQAIKCPDIPHDAAGAKQFWGELKSQLGKIDLSSEDNLTKWIDIPRALLGDLREVMHKLHNNSQGLVRLDRYIGAWPQTMCSDISILAAPQRPTTKKVCYR